MKKIVKVLSVLIAPIMLVCTLLSACKKPRIENNSGNIMQDMNAAPAQTPAYEQYSRQAIEEYKSVTQKHLDADGEVDTENEEVKQAARKAAARLYAYACYNERTLDKYAYFSNQEGETDLGGSGVAAAYRQEYYVRINESEDNCGYRYHYTIKMVDDSKTSGLVGTFKSSFESAKIRITDKTDLLYRFEGDKIRQGGEHEGLGFRLLTCDWKKGKDWGKPDIQMKKGEFIEPEDIKADIEKQAGEDNITIRGNINILADDIVKNALIIDNEDDDGVMAVMTIDTSVANKDEASLKMLRKANGSSDCVWVDPDEDTSGLTIVFRIWGNGMFRFFTVSESWSGNIEVTSVISFNGAADSVTTTYYSYSDRDCDMTENLKMLEEVQTQ